MEEKIIKKYLHALEIGSYEHIISLFAKNAIIFSPLYGKIKAETFYEELMKDTSKSRIKLLHIFKSNKKAVWAGYFRYEWKLKNGKETSFECVDVFMFDKQQKIKQLKIIYDTTTIRREFQEMKKDEIKLGLFKSITAKSKLTEKDALELGKKINKAMHERFKREHPGAY